MGRSYPITYTVQIVEVPPPGMPQMEHTPCEWRVRKSIVGPGHGKPTAENLEKFVMDYAASLKLGGVNEHLSKAAGYIPYPTSAYIKHQPSRQIVARWKAAMFQVFQ